MREGHAQGVPGGGWHRAIKMPQRLKQCGVADRDGHDMVWCEGYPVGPPGCGAPGAQPYQSRACDKDLNRGCRGGGGGGAQGDQDAPAVDQQCGNCG